MEHRRRHLIAWKLFHPVARLLARLLFGFRAERTEIEGPFLLLSNHNTDYDPILVGASFPQQMYFVASEHLMRAGLGGRLVSALFDPIARQKGGNASGTVMSVLRRLKKGCYVAIFPEGNRSWDGVTRSFPPATGKLARSCAQAGASLVTYRIEGGYFSSPRWAGASRRRGYCAGQVVRIYSPDELKAMKPDEINAAIARDLYTDAYALQREKRAEYKGKRLAEHLETLLFLCPQCGGVQTLESAGDTLVCSACGMRVRYLPTGFLEGDAPWDNLRDWNLRQEEQIRALCDAAGDEAIFTDTEMRCRLVDSGKSAEEIGRGELKLYRDRLELPGVTLPLGELTGVAIRGAQDIYFGAGERSYLVTCPKPRCVVRYITALSHLNHCEYGV